MSYNSNSYLSIAPYYSVVGAELAAARSAFQAEAQEILSGITAGMSDYEKELYIHDQLAARVEYVGTENAHNAYGALVEGKAVCDGYSEAFGYLLRQAGIKSYIAIGASIKPNSSEAVGHAWNYVCIDGKYYQVDVTWNDQGETLYHMYFNQTDAVMSEDHAVDHVPYALPECNSADAFYFTGKPEMLDSYSTAEIAALLEDNGYLVHVYVPAGVTNFINWFNANAYQICYGDLGLTGGFSYGFAYLGKEVICRINVPGASITGSISSADSGSDQTTVTLLKNGNPVKSTTVTGNKYGFHGIPEGNYTLRISKYGHISREYPVSVVNEDVDVSQNVVVCLIGDTNMDGAIDYADLQRLYAYLAFSDPEMNLDEYGLLIADANSDDSVDFTDIQRIFYHMISDDKLY